MDERLEVERGEEKEMILVLLEVGVWEGLEFWREVAYEEKKEMKVFCLFFRNKK